MALAHRRVDGMNEEPVRFTRGEEQAPGAWFGSVSKEVRMLYTNAVILLVLWLLGLVSSYAIGGFIHVLLVVAIVLFLVGLLSGRRVV